MSPMRCFSLVSSPNSYDLQFAMRVEGDFTRQITTLEPGERIRLRGPFGDFVLDPVDKRVVLLAAGIGITPFISMLRHAAETGSSTPFTLLYANRSADAIPFYDELEALRHKNPNMRVAYIVSEGATDPEHGIYRGRINEDLLQKVTNSKFHGISYFICGPSHFTRSLESVLLANRVDPSRVITESFTQKTKLSWNPRNLSATSLTYAVTGLALLSSIGLVMVADLSRYIPKVSALAATTNSSSAASLGSSASSSTAPASANTNSTTNTPNYASTPSPSSSNSYTAPSQTVAPTPAPTQTYQPPISSIS